MSRLGSALAFSGALVACTTDETKIAETPTSPVPSFQRAVVPVLAQHCAGAKDCHGDDPAEDLDLDLRPRAAYASVVEHPAEGRKGAVRVQPFAPDASFLLDKLSGRLIEGEGKAMPIDADTGALIEPSPLPRGFIADVLEPWIRAGAPDN